MSVPIARGPHRGDGTKSLTSVSTGDEGWGDGPEKTGVPRTPPPRNPHFLRRLGLRSSSETRVSFSDGVPSEGPQIDS